MSNKLKVKEVPDAMSLFICRQIHQGEMTARQYKKGRTSLGYTKKAQQMLSLGYRPKFAKYESIYSWMSV